MKNTLRILCAGLFVMASANFGMDAPNQNTYTLDELFELVQSGSVQEIEEVNVNQLRDAFQRIRTTDRDRMTLLHAAVFHSNLPVADYLLRMGAPVDAHDGTGLSPLFYNFLHQPNAQAMADLLLQRGANVNAINPSTNNTLLHVAVRQGNEWAVRALVERGARLDVVNRNGETALYQATLYGYDRLVALLLSHGANPMTAQNALKSLTPEVRKRMLGHFIMYGFPSTENEINQFFGLARLERAAAAGNIRALRTFLRRYEKGEKNMGNPDGALLYAVGRCQLQAVIYLLKKGVLVNSATPFQALVRINALLLQPQHDVNRRAEYERIREVLVAHLCSIIRPEEPSSFFNLLPRDLLRLTLGHDFSQ